MKTLFLCRHAKSDQNASMPDHDRPLNNRGLRSAPLMARVWKSNGEIPRYWLSSSANRALHTAQLMYSALRHTRPVEIDKELYHADLATFLKKINSLPAKENAAVIFGHNPGITEIQNYLTGHLIDNLPTCGMVKIEFDVDDWSLITKDSGRFCWFEFPRKYE
jgi:phosphohistidine phosphatase